MPTVERSSIPRPPFTALLALSLCAIVGFISPLQAAAQTDVAHMSGAGRDIRKIVIAEGIYQFMTMRDSYVRQLNSVAIVNEHDVFGFRHQYPAFQRANYPRGNS